MDLQVGRTAILVTVPGAQDLVGRVRDELDPAAALGVPPHVTVLYPWLDLDRVLPDDLTALGEICDREHAFDVTFGGFGRFPGVLWLAPDPAAPFVRLTEAIAHRWPQAPPYGGVHDGVIPHLTVMDLAGAGLDAADEPKMADVVRRLAPGLPVRHRVDEVVLMVFGGEAFATIDRFPLAAA